MTEMSSPPAASGMAAAAEQASKLEDTLIDKEQVVAGFASIDWGSYGRTTLSADEVGGLGRGWLTMIWGWVVGSASWNVWRRAPELDGTGNGYSLPPPMCCVCADRIDRPTVSTPPPPPSSDR